MAINLFGTFDRTREGLRAIAASLFPGMAVFAGWILNLQFPGLTLVTAHSAVSRFVRRLT